MWSFPADSDLVDPDSRLFEFVADRGYRFIGDGRSLLLQALMVTKPGHRLLSSDLASTARAIRIYLDGISGVSDVSDGPWQVTQDRDFSRCADLFVYKFVTEETYDRFVSRGSFLLSSLTRFRDFETQLSPAGDRMEGYSVVVCSIDDRELVGATLSGFDTLIYSVSRDLSNRRILEEKFGKVILKINVVPFVNEIASALGVSGEARYIRYSDVNVHRARLSRNSVAGFPPHLTARLARALRKKARLPSLFTKPSRFEVEREVRLAFQLSRDAPYMRSIDRPRLMNYVERIR